MFEKQLRNIEDIIDPHESYVEINLLGHTTYVARSFAHVDGFISFESIELAESKRMFVSPASLYSIRCPIDAERAARIVTQFTQEQMLQIMDPNDLCMRSGYVTHIGWARLKMAEEFGEDWEARGYRLEFPTTMPSPSPALDFDPFGGDE